MELINWRLMEDAPKDGSHVLLLIYHANRRFAETYAEQERWTDEVEAHWIDHNGGGWTWNGMMGQPIGWKPLK